MKIVALDLETTGLDPEKHRILEAAFVFEDTEAPELLPVEELPHFTFCIEWPDVQGDFVALDMNWELIRAIPGRADSIRTERNGFAAWKVSRNAFRAWVGGLGLAKGDKLIPCGKNVSGFDLPFLRAMGEVFSRESIANAFDYRVLDLGSVAMGLEPGLFKEKRVPDMRYLLRMVQDPRQVSHTALEDARDNLRVLRGLTNHYNRGT